MLHIIRVYFFCVLSKYLAQATQHDNDTAVVKSSFLFDITNIKHLANDEHIQQLDIVAKEFPVLCLTSGISEVADDLGTVLGSLDGKYESKLILTVSVNTVQDCDHLEKQMESIFTKYDLGRRCEAILFALSQSAFEVFNHTEIRSKIRATNVNVKTGISVQSWMDNIGVDVTLPDDIDILEVSANLAASLFTITLFEDYIETVLEPYISVTKKEKNIPMFLLRSKVDLPGGFSVSNETMTKYLCLQTNMMYQISEKKNVRFVLNIIDDTGTTKSISSNVNQVSSNKSCLPAKNLQTSVFHSPKRVAPYEWVEDPPSLVELLVISRLLTSTYTSVSMSLEPMSSLSRAAFLRRFDEIASINLGVFIPIENPNDSIILDSLLTEVAKHEIVSISAIHIKLSHLVLHLQYQQDSKGQPSNASLSEIAEEFREKLNSNNFSLVAICDDSDISGAIYNSENDKISKQVADVRDALLISDVVLWFHPFDQLQGAHNFLVQETFANQMFFITLVYHKFRNSHPNPQIILGLGMGDSKWNKAKLCQPKMGLSYDEFLKFMYNWAGVYDIKVTETFPFSVYTDNSHVYGRWSVIPHVTLGLNGSLEKTTEAPCEKWNPAPVETSTYTKLSSTGISINLSSLSKIPSSNFERLLRMAVARFQSIELVISDKANLTEENSCLLDLEIENTSVLHQIQNLPETTNSTKLYFSLEQENNLHETVSCLNKQIKKGNKTGILTGIHVSLKTILAIGNSPKLSNQILGSIDEIQKAKLIFGAVFPKCSFETSLRIPQTHFVILNEVEYLICDIPPLPLASYPLNFARLRYHLDIARAMLVRMGSYKMIWMRNPKVIIRIGWPKPANMTKDEINKNSLKFFRDVHELTVAFQIPCFIKEAFESEDSDYVGWWYGDTNDTKSITERESEFLVSRTWKPETPKLSQIPLTNSNIWVWVFVGLLLTLLIITTGIAFFLYRKHGVKNILSKDDIEDFFGKESDKTQTEEPSKTSPTCIKKYDKKYEIPWKEIQLDKATKIGSGQFGILYSTRLRSENVAVKVAKERTRICLKSVMSEIQVMGMLEHHINVLKFVGAYTKDLKRGIVCLVTEFCETGSLHAYLQSLYTNACPQDSPSVTRTTQMFSLVSIHQLCKFCQEIACGMNFLGLQNVVHGDLSARNILLNWQLTCKISDFGLSRKVDQYTCSKENNTDFIPWRWMAIEALNSLEFTVKSDVWSFGVTAWEVFSLGSVPYAGLTWSTDFTSDLTNGLRLPQPTYASDALYKILTDCWENQPVDRPEFLVLCEAFKRNCPSDYACL